MNKKILGLIVMLVLLLSSCSSESFEPSEIIESSESSDISSTSSIENETIEEVEIEEETKEYLEEDSLYGYKDVLEREINIYDYNGDIWDAYTSTFWIREDSSLLIGAPYYILNKSSNDIESLEFDLENHDLPDEYRENNVLGKWEIVNPKIGNEGEDIITIDKNFLMHKNKYEFFALINPEYIGQTHQDHLLFASKRYGNMYWSIKFKNNKYTLIDYGEIVKID